jgi:hypothetical protein
VPNSEAAEPAKLDLFAFIQSSGDAVENDLNQLLGVLFSHVRLFSYFFNQISFCHFGS